MLILSDFFAPEEVRAVLGVSDLEFEDDVLDLELYPRHLEIELAQIGQNLAADFVTASAAPSPTATDLQLVALTKQFSLYCIAALVAESMPNFSPRNISDGKGGFIRHSDSYKEVLARVGNRLQQAGERLKTAYTAYVGSSAAVVLPTFMAVSTPGYDPVTGA